MKSYKGFKIGDFVYPKVAESAYYSGYAGNPVQNFAPENYGRVSSIAPKVRMSKYDREPYFLVVDFISKDQRVWRSGINIKNAIKCRKGFKPHMYIMTAKAA